MSSTLLLRAAHGRLQVNASTRPGGQKPDPFDRHASPRDKQSQGHANRSSRANVPKGGAFGGQQRRRGRPAHLRSPDDSPLRDGNRDRLVGMLTERAAKTLLVYLQEMNPTVYHWLFCYLKDNTIPLQGTWDEVSGDAFLRKMLSMGPETARMGHSAGQEALFDNMARIAVDPRQLAQRIMEIRVQLSREFIQDLSLISDENSVLLRETLQASLANALTADPHGQLPPRDVSKVFVHPELLTQGGTLHPEVAQTHPELLPVVRKQAELKGKSEAGGSQDNGDAKTQAAHSAVSASATPAATAAPAAQTPQVEQKPSSGVTPPSGKAASSKASKGPVPAPSASTQRPPAPVTPSPASAHVAANVSASVKGDDAPPASGPASPGGPSSA